MRVCVLKLSARTPTPGGNRQTQSAKHQPAFISDEKIAEMFNSQSFRTGNGKRYENTVIFATELSNCHSHRLQTTWFHRILPDDDQKIRRVPLASARFSNAVRGPCSIQMWTEAIKPDTHNPCVIAYRALIYGRPM